MTASHVVADIYMYDSSSGGRKGPTTTGYWGCLFDFEGQLYDCRVLLDETGPLAPGQTARTPIVFLKPESLRGRLQTGARFQLRELATVAEGTVVNASL